MRFSSWLRVAARNPSAALRFAANRINRTIRVKLIETPWLYERIDRTRQQQLSRNLVLHKVLDPQVFELRHEEVDGLLRHELTVLGKTIVFPDKVNWLADFQGGEWPSLLAHQYNRLLARDFSMSEYRTHGDIKRVWDLNKQHHFVDLAIAFKESQDPKYQAEIVDQFLDWNERFPYMHGIGWQQPLIVAQRAINWIICYNLNAFPETVHIALAKSLFYHGKYMAENLEMSYTGNNSNHLIGDLAALNLIGLTLQKHDWARSSMKMLLDEIRKQIYPDGVDYEQSSGYHRYVLEFLTLVWHANKQQPPPLTDTISRMSNFLNDIAWEDDSLPFLSDWDGAKVWVSNHHRPVELYRFGRKSRESVAYRNAGYYALKGGPFHVVFDCGPIGMGGKQLATHGHSDLLSFTMGVKGHAFIVDPGSGTYTENQQVRNYLRSTAGHNTITVDNRDQCGLVGTWAVEKQPRHRLTTWHPGEDLDIVCGEHDGYFPIIHTREIQLFKRAAAELKIKDEILGSGNHSYQCYLHLSPEAQYDVSGTTVELAVRGTRLAMHFDPRLEVRIDKGWYSPDYGQWIEAPVLVFEGKSPLPARIEWRYVIAD